MSAINTDGLKSASDPSISFETEFENFTTIQIRHDWLLEHGMLIKSVKIVNDDTLAPVTFRTKSPSSTLITVDPLSSETLDGWTSYLEVNPNAVSGKGQIQIDYSRPQDARR